MKSARIMKQTLGKLGSILIAVLLGVTPAAGSLQGASPCETAPCCCSGASVSAGHGAAEPVVPEMAAMDCCSPTAAGGRCRLRADAIPAPTCFIGSQALHTTGWVLSAGIRIPLSPDGEGSWRSPSAMSPPPNGATPLYLVKQTLLR
jgi:hypothetical protein